MPRRVRAVAIAVAALALAVPATASAQSDLWEVYNRTLSQGPVHQPHPHDHAEPAGLEGFRARHVQAGGRPDHRDSVHLREGRVRGNGVHDRDRPVRHAVRSSGALGPGVRRDR